MKLFHFLQFLKPRLIAAAIFTMLISTLSAVSASSTIVGTWKLDGPEPQPTTYQNFKLLRLDFHSDSTVVLRYLPMSPYLQGYFITGESLRKALQPTESTTRYFLRGADTILLKSGSELVKWHYEIPGTAGDILLLTPPSQLGQEQPATIYHRVNGAVAQTLGDSVGSNTASQSPALSADTRAWLGTSPNIVVKMQHSTTAAGLRPFVSIVGNQFGGGYIQPTVVGLLKNGQEVIIIPLDSGGSMHNDDALVFTKINGVRRFVGDLPTPGGHLIVEIKGGYIRTSTLAYSAGVQIGQHVVDYTLNGIRLVQVSERVVTP